MYYTVKINFSGKNVGVSGLQLDNKKIKLKKIATSKAAGNKKNETASEKKDKKNTLGINLGYIGKLEVSTIYQVLLNPNVN